MWRKGGGGVSRQEGKGNKGAAEGRKGRKRGRAGDAYDTERER